MDKVLRTLVTIPTFIAEMFTDHPVLATLGILIFLLALMVPGRIGSLIRKIVILANVMFAMAGGFMGRNQNGYQIICLSAISLLLLLIIRTVVRIITSMNQRKEDARIEERALAKAAKRRRSFRKQQTSDAELTGSGDFVPPDISQTEIREVIEKEISKGRERNRATLAAAGRASSGSDTEGSGYEPISPEEVLLAGNLGFEYSRDEEAWDDTDEEGYEPIDTGDASEADNISYEPLKADDTFERDSDQYTDKDAGQADIKEDAAAGDPGQYLYSAAEVSLDDAIKKAVANLSELYAKGILSEEEFIEEKNKLMALGK